MLLLIDIGNSKIKTGFYEKSIENIQRIDAGTRETTGEGYLALINDIIHEHKLERPEGAVISSVVPETTRLLFNTLKSHFNLDPVIVNHKIKTGLKFSIKNPDKLGADRIANAAGARKLYGGNLIVADFGTATTICVITEDGDYRGGAIMPGLGMSVNMLAEETAMLPRVDLKTPFSIIGKDTNENILSGVILGHAGAFERIVSEIKGELKRNMTVIATGGYIQLLRSYIKVNHINLLLTFEGLRSIYELNADMR